jgi:hypothetical protein
VNTDLSTTNVNIASNRRPVVVTISPWVNEPCPDLRRMLCSRDVARLIRRPRWMLYGLALIGRFPRKQRYRGRPIGWQRLEVLDWLTKGLDAANDESFNPPSQTQGACDWRHPRQTKLPLECGVRCALVRQCADLARKPITQSRVASKYRRCTIQEQ